MSRHRKPHPLEEQNWEHWILNYVWNRTARNEVTHERFTQLEALAKDFIVKHPAAVTTAIAKARAKDEDPGLDEVLDLLHPKLKAFAATRGIELVDYDPSPY